jgi:hypothetical protein
MPVRVRLTRKLAKVMNGVDVSAVREGQEIDLSQREAEVLIAAGWATPSHPAPLAGVAREKSPRGRGNGSVAPKTKSA